MLYIPKTLGEVSDQLSLMVLTAPDFLDPVFPWQNRDTVFRQLSEGLDNVKRKLGETGFERLKEAMLQARQLCDSGEGDAARDVLAHMKEYIRLGKYKTDEEVVDESRFEPRL